MNIFWRIFVIGILCPLFLFLFFIPDNLEAYVSRLLQYLLCLVIFISSMSILFINRKNRNNDFVWYLLPIVFAGLSLFAAISIYSLSGFGF